MRNYLCTLILGALSATVALAATDVPEPSLVPQSWELKFRFQDPQRISVFVPGKAEPVVYWYMLYRVENPTGDEVGFFPTFDLVTDTLQVVRSNIDVSPAAFGAIYDRTGDPLLIPPEKVIGRLLRGEDRAKRSVAIWPDFDPKAKRFTIYVAGLSGEVKAWKNPVFDPDKKISDDNKPYFLLRKTLAIPYKLPGSKEARSRSVPERVPEEQRWIMR